uniref:Uncharacterized protein n=1 Tax=Lepisosteus oculatus TaxID=7918 RepID=W5MKN7_LEPOC
MAKQEGAPQGPLSEQGHTEPQPVTASGGDRQHTAGEQECTGTGGPPVPPGTGSELPGGPSTPETGELPSGRQWSPRAHPPARSRPGARPSREVKRDVQLPQQQEEKQDGHRASRERPAVKEEVSCRDSEGLDRGEQGSSTASIPKPCHCDASHQHSDTEQRLGDPRGTGPFYYIGGGNGVAIVRAYCEGRGWQRVCDKTREDYTLRWCETKSHSAYCRFREGEQLLYQVPNNKVLTTKIGLLSSLREYERVASKVKPGRGHRSVWGNRHPNHSEGRLELQLQSQQQHMNPTELLMEVLASCLEISQNAADISVKNLSYHFSVPTQLASQFSVPLIKEVQYILIHQLQLQNRLAQLRHLSSFSLLQKCPDLPSTSDLLKNTLGNNLNVFSKLTVRSRPDWCFSFQYTCAINLQCFNLWEVCWTAHSRPACPLLPPQYMQKKNPLYNEVKEETVWSMERFNDYVNEKFRAVRALPQDWVLSVFT